MSRREFSPGFRLSPLDVAVLILGTVGVIALKPSDPVLAFIVAFVVGHFFLFCNVVRMARPLELCWAGWFMLLAGSTLTTGRPGWNITTAASLAMTLIVVLIELRKPSYHGLGWQQINPNLQAWWESHVS